MSVTVLVEYEIDNDISDEGAAKICESLKINTSLTRLNLTSVQLFTEQRKRE